MKPVSEPRSSNWIAIGDFARRSGVAASALRFYEGQRLAVNSTESNSGDYLKPTQLAAWMTEQKAAFVRAR